MPSKPNGKSKPQKSMLTPEEQKLLKNLLHQKGTVVDLAYSELKIDWRYQKRARERIANQIHRECFEFMLGVLMVARRPDGTLWVFDGVTRMEGLRLRGETDRMMRCIVFNTEGYEQESMMFALWNSQRAKAFIRKETALIAYGHSGTDGGFIAAVEKCGYTLDGEAKTKLRGPGEVKKAWDLDDSGKAMVPTLFATKEVWKHRYRVYGYMVLGIALLFHSQPRPIDDQVRRVLGRNTPDDILEKIHTTYAKIGGKRIRIHPGDMPPLIARMIADDINKRPGKGGRIDMVRLRRTLGDKDE